MHDLSKEVGKGLVSDSRRLEQSSFHLELGDLKLEVQRVESSDGGTERVTDADD
jgi:hypothetical protein